MPERAASCFCESAFEPSPNGAPALLAPPVFPLQPRDPKRDPQVSEAKNLMRRKRVQLEHAREYDEAVVSLKTKVKELEGQDMRETIQDKVRGGEERRGAAGRRRRERLGEER